MPFLVIAGKANCPHFVHAIQIAAYIKDHLPDFAISRREFREEDWTNFLLEINQSNGWFITTSPVIWKELGLPGSKPLLIGGLSEFWEHIDNYYGTKTFLNSEQVAELCSQNFESFKIKTHDPTEKLRSSIVGIYGFNDLAKMLLPELFQVPNLFSKNMVTIKIYNKDSSEESSIEDEIKTYIREIQAHVKFDLVLCPNLSYFVEKTDFILITEDYSRRDDNRQSWLKRCSRDMRELTVEVNDNGGDNLKIICCHSGPVCFTATSITKRIHNRYQKNVVAVTAQEGLKAAGLVSKLTDMALSNLTAPTVWGFVGLDQYVDIQSIIVCQNIVRPYKRAIKDKKGSNMPQKREKKELRHLSCMANKKNYENGIIERCNLYSRLGKTPILPLLRATIHLLSLWSSPEHSRDLVISLGIFSDGSFGIPPNIVFSQPVTLNENNVWVPFDELPVHEQSHFEIETCKNATVNLIETIKDYL